MHTEREEAPRARQRRRPAESGRRGKVREREGKKIISYRIDKIIDITDSSGGTHGRARARARLYEREFPLMRVATRRP